MAAPAGQIVLLASAPTEMEAGILAAALAENGITSRLTGQSVSGFRAEAPGWVQVLVAERDLSAAQEILLRVRRESAAIDWSQIDVGEPEAPDES
jgi:pheromone shutdown protein TraB